MEEDEVNETKIERIKRHFKENKKLYIGLAAGVAATFVVMTVKENRKSTALINQQNKEGDNIIKILVQIRRGHPGTMVMDNRTNEIYPSINSAAKKIGVSAPTLAKHLDGRIPHIDGNTYKSLGDAPATAPAKLELVA